MRTVVFDLGPQSSVVDNPVITHITSDIVYTGFGKGAGDQCILYHIASMQEGFVGIYGVDYVVVLACVEGVDNQGGCPPFRYFVMAVFLQNPKQFETRAS